MMKSAVFLMKRAWEILAFDWQFRIVMREFEVLFKKFFTRLSSKCSKIEVEFCIEISEISPKNEIFSNFVNEILRFEDFSIEIICELKSFRREKFVKRHFLIKKINKNLRKKLCFYMKIQCIIT